MNFCYFKKKQISQDMDGQRQRLKHLMANAILDLWKKETGSLSSVIIEGTICITSGNGTTIVVQVSEKFLGVIPDGSNGGTYAKSSTPPDMSPCQQVGNRQHDEVRRCEEEARQQNEEDMRQREELRQREEMRQREGIRQHELLLTPVRDFGGDRIHCSALASNSSYLTDISSDCLPTSALSRETSGAESRRWSSCSDQVFYPSSDKPADCDNDNRDSDSDSDELVVDNQDNDIQPSEQAVGSSSMADELSSSGYSSMLSKSSSSALERSQASGPGSPGNEGHTDDQDRSSSTPQRRRSASPAMVHSPSTSTPVDDSKRRRLQDGSESQDAGSRRAFSAVDTHDVWSNHIGHMSRSLSGSALDLSSGHRDHELSLSLPQNYTAQVRDVIRNRIMATKNTVSDTNGSTTPSVIVSSGTRMVNTSSSSSGTVETSVSGSTYQPTSDTKNSIPVLYPQISSADTKTSLPDLKLPLLPPNGPASWPVASTGQDKQNVMPPPPPFLSNSSRLLLPNNFSLLSVGLPNGPPLMPGSLSPSLFPSFFPPSIMTRGMPLHPGVSLGALPTLGSSSAPLISPKTPSSQGSSTPSIGVQENEDGRYWDYASGRSTPELTDINGNSEKHVAPPSTTSSSSAGEQKVYVCEYCSKQFLFKSKYHEHLPVHTNARPYQCHLCSRTYKYKYDLQVHLRTHMGIPTKSTVCPFCMQKFETNKMLRNHIVEMHRDRQKVTKEECTQPVDNLPPAL